MSKSESDSLIISTVDALTKFSLDLIPGASQAKAVYELMKVVGDNVGKYQERRNEKRVKDFHRGLLGGNSTLIGDLLDVEDYHALLKICLDDVEDDKSGIYGQFARAIAAGKVNEKYKRYLIIILGQLSHQQLEKLRRGWVATNYTLVHRSANGSISPKSVLLGDENEIMDEMDYESLSVRKLVKEGELTKLGNQLAESCFRRDQLMPEAIGETSWVGGALDVITAETVHHSTMQFLERLLSLMHSSLVKANLYDPVNEFYRSELLDALPFCIVLIRDVSLFRIHMGAIRGMTDGRDTILAFIGKKDSELVGLFNASDVLECDETDQKSQTDMMNKINQAVRRKVKLAKKSQ